jgi:hypothetical protein
MEYHLWMPCSKNITNFKTQRLHLNRVAKTNYPKGKSAMMSETLFQYGVLVLLRNLIRNYYTKSYKNI